MTDLETLPDDVSGTPAVETPATPATPETPPAIPDTPTPVTPATEETPTAPTEREVVGRLNGQPHTLKVPAGFELRWKREGEEGYVPFDAVERSPMFEKDYQHKAQALAAQRRQLEATQVELAARQEQAAESRRRLIEAHAQGGEALRKELLHQELLETDPDYRDRWQESEEFRVRQKVDAWEETQANGDRAADVVSRARQYIEQKTAAHPELDAQDIMALYADALATGRAQLHEADVDRIIARELDRATKVRQPILQEVAQLRQELDAFKAQQQVQAHNATVTKAITNAREAPVGGRPARGAVPAAMPFKPFDPNTETEDAYKARRRAFLGAS